MEAAQKHIAGLVLVGLAIALPVIWWLVRHREWPSVGRVGGERHRHPGHPEDCPLCRQASEQAAGGVGRLAIHRGRSMREFLENGVAKHIHLEVLPPYAPDLNPDEGVWRHTKCVDLRNVCCLNLPDLHVHVRSAFERLRRRPALIQSFFAEANLAL
jgi:hypothetical protein